MNYKIQTFAKQHSQHNQRAFTRQKNPPRRAYCVVLQMIYPKGKGNTQHHIIIKMGNKNCTHHELRRLQAAWTIATGISSKSNFWILQHLKKRFVDLKGQVADLASSDSHKGTVLLQEDLKDAAQLAEDASVRVSAGFPVFPPLPPTYAPN